MLLTMDGFHPMIHRWIWLDLILRFIFKIYFKIFIMSERVPNFDTTTVFKVAHGVSQQLFLWTRVLTHSKYVEIKQFSKLDIKQNNVPTIILSIKFLVYQWDPRHLQGSGVVYIFVYIKKSVFYLKYPMNHIFGHNFEKQRDKK